MSTAPLKPARPDGHSYLWGQVFFTEPVGQWLCPAGHSCRWSVARTDAGVMGRVERRRAAVSEAAKSVSAKLPTLLAEGSLARVPFVTIRELLEALAGDRAQSTPAVEAAVRAWMEANHWRHCRYRMPFGRSIEWGYERPEVSARRDPRNKDAGPLIDRAQALDGIDQPVEGAVDGLDRIADVPLGHGARVLIRAGLHVHADERRMPLGEPVAELLIDGVNRSVEVTLSGDLGLRVELVQRGDSLHLHSGAPSVVVAVRGDHRRAEASTQPTPEGGAR